MCHIRATFGDEWVQGWEEMEVVLPKWVWLPLKVDVLCTRSHPGVSNHTSTSPNHLVAGDPHRIMTQNIVLPGGMNGCKVGRRWSLCSPVVLSPLKVDVLCTSSHPGVCNHTSSSPNHLVAGDPHRIMTQNIVSLFETFFSMLAITTSTCNIMRATFILVLARQMMPAGVITIGVHESQTMLSGTGLWCHMI